MQILLEWAKVIAPIVIALIGIVPTIKKKANETNEEIKKNALETNEEIKKLRNRIDSVEQKIDAVEKKADDNTAVEWRVRILRFDDDLCNSNSPYPSEASFMQTLNDVDKYRKYIREHTDFQNGIGASAMDHIEEMWDECKHKNLFGKFK